MLKDSETKSFGIDFKNSLTTGEIPKGPLVTGGVLMLGNNLNDKISHSEAHTDCMIQYVAY